VASIIALLNSKIGSLVSNKCAGIFDKSGSKPTYKKCRFFFEEFVRVVVVLSYCIFTSAAKLQIHIAFGSGLKFQVLVLCGSRFWWFQVSGS